MRQPMSPSLIFRIQRANDQVGLLVATSLGDFGKRGVEWRLR